MSERVRDSQRSRVYAASSMIALDSRWMTTLDEMQQFVDQVTADPRWAGPSPVAVRLARIESRTSICHDDGRGGISVSPRYGANVLTLLHELAHALVTEGADHSPQFCRTWLELVKRHGGVGEARRLADAMDQCRVRR